MWKERKDKVSRESRLFCRDVKQLIAEEARQRQRLHDDSEAIQTSKALENLNSEAVEFLFDIELSGKQCSHEDIDERWNARYRMLVREVMEREFRYKLNISWCFGVAIAAKHIVTFLHEVKLFTVLEICGGRQALGDLCCYNFSSISEERCSIQELSWVFTDIDERCSAVVHKAVGISKQSLILDAVQACESRNEEVLVISWPPFGDSVAVRALRAFQGKWLVYLGEDRHGCTADDDFFALLQEQYTCYRYVNLGELWYIPPTVQRGCWIYQRICKEASFAAITDCEADVA